jgi:hypothetical protein
MIHLHSQNLTVNAISCSFDTQCERTNEENACSIVDSYLDRLRVNDDDGCFSIPFIFDDKTKSGQSSSA